MDPFVQYVVEGVVGPALVAALVAAVCALHRGVVWPFKRRSAEIEGMLGLAMMLAFTLSFLSEREINTILRQVMTIEGDDMPTERWHRLGLTALILALGAPLLALLRDRLPKRFAFTVSAGACVLVAILVGVFVEFPNSPIWWRVAQGALVVASTAAYALAARDVALWSAWICFAVLAVLAERSGFASMALMCGATSAAAFASAAVFAIAPRLKSGVERVPIGGALALVLGALSSVVASCGRAYDSTGVSPWMWVCAPLLPVGGALLFRFTRKAQTPLRGRLWRLAGVAFLAGGLLVAIALKYAGGSGDENDPYAAAAAAAASTHAPIEYLRL